MGKILCTFRWLRKMKAIVVLLLFVVCAFSKKPIMCDANDHTFRDTGCVLDGSALSCPDEKFTMAPFRNFNKRQTRRLRQSIALAYNGRVSNHRRCCFDMFNHVLCQVKTVVHHKVFNKFEIFDDKVFFPKRAIICSLRNLRKFKDTHCVYANGEPECPSENVRPEPYLSMSEDTWKTYEARMELSMQGKGGSACCLSPENKHMYCSVVRHYDEFRVPIGAIACSEHDQAFFTNTRCSFKRAPKGNKLKRRWIARCKFARMPKPFKNYSVQTLEVYLERMALALNGEEGGACCFSRQTRHMYCATRDHTEIFPSLIEARENAQIIRDYMSNKTIQTATQDIQDGIL